MPVVMSLREEVTVLLYDFYWQKAIQQKRRVLKHINAALTNVEVGLVFKSYLYSHKALYTYTP